MNSNTVLSYLQKIKSTKKFDEEYLDLIIKGFETKQDGSQMAKDILKIIEKRYAENQQNNN